VEVLEDAVEDFRLSSCIECVYPICSSEQRIGPGCPWYSTIEAEMDSRSQSLFVEDLGKVLLCHMDYDT
jgi:hypothetical protein